MKESPLLIALCIFFLFNMLLRWAFPSGPVVKCQAPNAGGVGIIQLLHQLHILGTMLRQKYIILSIACKTYPRMTMSKLKRFTDIPVGILFSTWTCKERNFFFSFSKRQLWEPCFTAFSESWNLILLILSPLLALSTTLP